MLRIRKSKVFELEKVIGMDQVFGRHYGPISGIRTAIFQIGLLYYRTVISLTLVDTMTKAVTGKHAL